MGRPRGVPDYARQVPTFKEWSEPGAPIPAATGPIEYRGEFAARDEYGALRSAIEATGADFWDMIVTAASPGMVTSYPGNDYYSWHAAFPAAVADAVKADYELVAGTGATLQVDAPTSSAADT